MVALLAVIASIGNILPRRTAGGRGNAGRRPLHQQRDKRRLRFFAPLIQPATIRNQHIVTLLIEVQRLRGVVVAHFIALHHHSGRQAIDAPPIVLHLHVDDCLIALIFRDIRATGFQAADNSATYCKGTFIIFRALFIGGRGNDIQAIDHHHIAAGVPCTTGSIRKKTTGDFVVISRHGRSLIEISQRQIRVIARLRCNNFPRTVFLPLVGPDHLRPGVARQSGTTADKKHCRCGAKNRGFAIVPAEHAHFLLPSKSGAL